MASNRVYASYQEIIDLHTEENHVSVIGIHTPTGDTPRKMFKGLFEQFKKYKYKGCSISLVPAARLPADIESVGLLAGEPNLDARDLLNPIMFHGCHGEDLGNILNRLYSIGSSGMGGGGLLDFDTEEFGGVFSFSEFSDPALQSGLENLYYKALVDNTWKKAHPQRGFRKSGLRPLVYSMATTHQLGNASYGNKSPGNGVMGTLYNGTDIGINGEPLPVYSENGETSASMSNMLIYSGTQILTPHLTGLGYLDTRTVLDSSGHAMSVIMTSTNLKNLAPNFFRSYENWTQLPLVFMGVILLPPAYKAEQYYRMIVNHKFVFKDFRGISMANSQFNSPTYFNPEHGIDNAGKEEELGSFTSLTLHGALYKLADSTLNGGIDGFSSLRIDVPVDNKSTDIVCGSIVGDDMPGGHDSLQGCFRHYQSGTSDYLEPMIVGFDESRSLTRSKVYKFSPTTADPTRFTLVSGGTVGTVLTPAPDLLELDLMFGDAWDLVADLYNETKDANSEGFVYDTIEPGVVIE